LISRFMSPNRAGVVACIHRRTLHSHAIIV